MKRNCKFDFILQLKVSKTEFYDKQIIFLNSVRNTKYTIENFYF